MRTKIVKKVRTTRRSDSPTRGRKVAAWPAKKRRTVTKKTAKK